jgi:hypothetical protein
MIIELVGDGFETPVGIFKHTKGLLSTKAARQMMDGLCRRGLLLRSKYPSTRKIERSANTATVKFMAVRYRLSVESKEKIFKPSC